MSENANPLDWALGTVVTDHATVDGHDIARYATVIGHTAKRVRVSFPGGVTALAAPELMWGTKPALWLWGDYWTAPHAE